MSGIKGRSGGKRAGAGRPPSKVSVKIGQEWAYRVYSHERWKSAIITEIGHNRIVLKLRSGEVIELIR